MAQWLPVAASLVNLIGLPIGILGYVVRIEKRLVRIETKLSIGD
ncbi:hypothetical protein OYT13_11395 [Pandoraea sp. XJJ-1]|nr:hypothetical protein [Pandoraea sp. XJJ-1]WAL84952.1 hypothetical protein OYT13_11395 [Pandoraea sp. XJJ-1]